MRGELQLGRLWRTVRPLRPEQLLGRITHELRQRAFRRVPPLLQWRLGAAPALSVALQLPATISGEDERLVHAQRVASEGVAWLAGHEVPIRAWRDDRLSKLVRYHLHYLDAARELAWAGTVLESSGLREQALSLVSDWARDNPVRGSEGWEPYAVAARLQNLGHIAALWGASTPEWLRALMGVHARYLRLYPETHLQANHLLKDWVALALAGLIFEGREANEWQRQGLAEIRRELDEQILPDGGHYERSPMYHSLVLADLLDVRDFARARGMHLGWLEGTIGRMASMLAGILHPDGEIPLFNDAVIGQAPAPGSLFGRLAAHPQVPSSTIVDSPHFGLTAVKGNSGELLLMDSGPLGPDHQPGHAHSDTLSYELSVAGVRCAVNSGVDGYQSNARAHFRSAAAHNTITVDGQGPDELWSAFRVGGRGRVSARDMVTGESGSVLTGSVRAHQGWVHSRTLVLVPGKALVVVDDMHDVPVAAEIRSRVRLVPDSAVRFVPLWNAQARTASSPYAPRFGRPLNIEEHSVVALGPRATLGYALLWGASEINVVGTATELQLTLDGVRLVYARPRPQWAQP